MARDRLPPIEFEPADDGPSSSSSAPEPAAEHDRHRPRRPGRWVAAGAVAVLGLVTVAILDQPSHDSSTSQSPTTTSAPASPTTRFAPASPTTTTLPLPTHYKASSYLVDVDTGKRSELPAGLAEGFSFSGTFVSGYVPSPDGNRVVAFNQCPSTLTPCAGSGRMAVGNIDGSGVRTITQPGAGWSVNFVSWSPDSAKIVYEAVDTFPGDPARPAVGLVFVEDVATGASNLITPPDGRRVTTPSWSPDGTTVVYAALDDDAPDFAELFIEDLTTGARNQITHLERVSAGALLSPRFTPDGQSVLFMLPRGSFPYSDVWSVPATGGVSTLMIEDAEFPTPLPDGTVAFERFFWRGIWVANIDAPGSVRPLIPQNESVLGMTASPDGTRLIYVRPGFGTPDLDTVKIVDVNTGAVSNVLNGGGAAWLDTDTLVVTAITSD